MKIDKATVLGLILAVGGICFGLVLEGGSIWEVVQPTAALIVFGGTFGATLVSQPFPIIARSFKAFVSIFSEPTYRLDQMIETIVNLSNQARRNGIVSLEKQMELIPHPFLRKAVTLAVDGAESHEIRRIMELEMEQESARQEAGAKVLETAGGVAPTVGIIGAVLGLIQVMKHLENIDEVGKGIAVAFVATIYGVGVANLILLPGAKKIMIRAHQEATMKDLMLEGVVSIAEGLNPRLIQQRLEGFLERTAEPAPKNDSARTSTRPAEV